MVYLNVRLVPPLNIGESAESLLDGSGVAGPTAGNLLKPSGLVKPIGLLPTGLLPTGLLPTGLLPTPNILGFLNPGQDSGQNSPPGPPDGNPGNSQGDNTGGSDGGGNAGNGGQGSGNNGGITAGGGQTTAGNGGESTGGTQPTNSRAGNTPATVTGTTEGTRTTAPQGGQTEGGRGSGNNGNNGAQPTQSAGSVFGTGGGGSTGVLSGSTNIEQLPLSNSATAGSQILTLGGQELYVTPLSSGNAQASPTMSTPTVFTTYSLVTSTDSAGNVHVSTSMFTTTSYVSVPSPTSTSATNTPPSSPAGLIGGLVAGIVILLILITLAIRRLLRKRRIAAQTILFDEHTPNCSFTAEGASSYPGTPTSLEFAAPPSPMAMVASKSRSSLVSSLIASVRKKPVPENGPDAFLSASRRSSASFGLNRWSSNTSLVSRSSSFRSLTSVQEEEQVDRPNAARNPFADPKPHEHNEKGIESDPFADPSPMYNHLNPPI